VKDAQPTLTPDSVPASGRLLVLDWGIPTWGLVPRTTREEAHLEQILK